MDNKGARSVIGDSMSITINFKWLLQLIVATAMLVYAFWTFEGRIQELERNMVITLDKIELHEKERLESQQSHVAEMEERMEWYETELNLNPFSWGKKHKKK